MQIPTKRLKTGFSLPVYGLGTWQMGGREAPDYSKDEQEVQAIKNAIELGLTHIDTAESYAAGHSEELVGQSIKGYDRSGLIIVSKVSGDNQSYDNLLKSFEASLKRLNTSYLDLYLLHRYPDQGIDIADTMRAMDRLVSEKVVRHIGVCNLTPERVDEVQKHTGNKIVYNQLHYSLEVREAEKRGLVKCCQDNDIILSAWGPLSKGALQNAPILQEMAEKYGKTPYQVALNWLIVQKNVITTPKTTQKEHLGENLGCLGWELSHEDFERLSREFPNQKDVSDRVPLDY